MTGHKISLLVFFFVAPLLIAVLAVGYFLLRYSNIAFVGGPTRGQVVQTAHDLLNKTMATTKTPITYGKTYTSFSPCGHADDGLGPLRYTGGIDVLISGVAPADHKQVEDQINNQGVSLAMDLPPKGNWLISVDWDSPTSTTGDIHSFLGCTEIAN